MFKRNHDDESILYLSIDTTIHQSIGTNIFITTFTLNHSSMDANENEGHTRHNRSKVLLRIFTSDISLLIIVSCQI